MKTASTAVVFDHTNAFDDLPTSVLCASAHRLVAQAVEAEFGVFLSAVVAIGDAGGRAGVARYGQGPKWSIQTRIGRVTVRRVRLGMAVYVKRGSLSPRRPCPSGRGGP